MVMRIFVTRLVFAVLACVGALTPTSAQYAPGEPGKAVVHLQAFLGQARAPLLAGLHWRIYNERADNDGTHVLAASSSVAQRSQALAPGEYEHHLACGLASAAERITLGDDERSERLTLNAGGLRIV